MKKSLRRLIVVIPKVVGVLVLAIVSMNLYIAVVFYPIGNKQFYLVSNIAIALSLGFASTCFSWVRALEPEAKDMIAIARNAGEHFIVSAIIFLFAAATNVTGSSLKTEWKKDVATTLYIASFSVAAMMISFAITTIFVKLMTRNVFSSGFKDPMDPRLKR